jgi:hypothetical protein
MRSILWALALVPALLVLGAVLGALQLAYYRVKVRAGRMKADDIPFFGALLLRGLAIAVALLAAGAIWSNIAAGPAH